ncbi:MAG: uracil-DNA glycosylase [Thermoplasmata archaeon]
MPLSMPSSGPRPPQAGSGHSGPGSDAVRSELADLAREIVACRRCPLGHTRTNAVVYRGSPAPRIVFVGEAPGAEEDRLGVPFVGRSGSILDTAIARLGLAPSEFGILNILKCRPPANKFDRAAAETCRPYLDRQLALLRPNLLVSLGASALRALDPFAPSVMKAAGAPRSAPGGTLFPLVHPAATLRSRRMKERWERDLGTLAERLGTAVV